MIFHYIFYYLSDGILLVGPLAVSQYNRGSVLLGMSTISAHGTLTKIPKDAVFYKV